MSNTQDQPNKPSQQGAPQQTQDMPSSGNSREVLGSTRGTDESSGGSQDVERSGMSGQERSEQLTLTRQATRAEHRVRPRA